MVNEVKQITDKVNKTDAATFLIIISNVKEMGTKLGLSFSSYFCP